MKIEKGYFEKITTTWWQFLQIAILDFEVVIKSNNNNIGQSKKC